MKIPNIGFARSSLEVRFYLECIAVRSADPMISAIPGPTGVASARLPTRGPAATST